MPETTFDYAVIRIVPRVERSEFINAGVILYARTQRFLDARISFDRERLRALFPDAAIAEIEQHLALIPKICMGGDSAGPIGELPQHERWHWLVAPKSTVIQMSEVHSGFCEDPAAELDHLMRTLVH
ncbi:MAG TPA: DUF3037 domain-containing protein [Candidatus Kapabacteria bacterium]|nr:DUF3037 domain-containing protein [Candidatus Kapabacteria bacterium]